MNKCLVVRKTGVEYLAQHRGWKTKRRKRTEKIYRYSDGNTYTDNLTRAEAERFERWQNGGTISIQPNVPNRELAKLLHGMASALEHGRLATFRRKLGIAWTILAERHELP